MEPGANTANPAGSPKITSRRPRPPSKAVTAKQDPTHTEADFAQDLRKATRRKPS